MKFYMGKCKCGRIAADRFLPEEGCTYQNKVKYKYQLVTGNNA